MAPAFPFLTTYDPPGTSEGSLDPLGLYQIADQLAIQLVPAVRERMLRIRFLTAMRSARSWSRTSKASANITEPGYRTNHEVVATVDLSPAEADGDLLTQAITFLRSLLALMPGTQDDTPVVRRALAYPSQVERQAENWKRPRRRTVVRRQLVCTLPAIESGTDARSSLDEAVARLPKRIADELSFNLELEAMP